MSKSTRKASVGDSPVSLTYHITVRMRMRRTGGTIAKILTCVERAGGENGALDPVREDGDYSERDLTIAIRDDEHGEKVVERLKKLTNVKVINVSNPVFLKHLGGKISVTPTIKIANRSQLSEVYTPGVAQVCRAIAKNKALARNLTMQGKMVAVISDGSRVLSLGNIGAEAALPVMEGKVMLFKQFGGVDAFPICLGTQDVEEIIRTITYLAPNFGAINLEDIASPGCYEIERRLQEKLDIPVFHDDQHATAIAVTAATINAAKLVGKPLSKLKLVACGVGAAGMACVKMLMAAGVQTVIGFNAVGAVYEGRTDLTEQEAWLAKNSNKSRFQGSLSDALEGADMFLGLSVGNVLKTKDVKRMAKDSIVFALANPVPEIDPRAAGKFVRIIATGGPYSNQINNALVFPGLFRGALKARVPRITEEMKMAAAIALSAVIEDHELNEHKIIPGMFDERVAQCVAKAVVDVAVKTGLARRKLTSDEI